jgi:hypothetical protein
MIDLVKAQDSNSSAGNSDYCDVKIFAMSLSKNYTNIEENLSSNFIF